MDRPMLYALLLTMCCPASVSRCCVVLLLGFLFGWFGSLAQAAFRLRLWLDVIILDDAR